MRKALKSILPVSMLWLITLSCNNNKTINITEGNTSQTFILAKNKDQQSVHALSLKISGNIDGKAIIKIGYTNNSFAKIDTVQQQIRFTYDGDWYSDSCYLTYQSLTGKTEKLDVQYKFYD